MGMPLAGRVPAARPRHAGRRLDAYGVLRVTWTLFRPTGCLQHCLFVLLQLSVRWEDVIGTQPGTPTIPDKLCVIVPRLTCIVGANSSKSEDVPCEIRTREG